MAGHFSGDRLYKLVSRHWWWETLYKDAVSYCRNCPECAIVSGVGRVRPCYIPYQYIVHFKYGEWTLWNCQLLQKETGTLYFKTCLQNGH